jgi:hypothetical protein
MSVADRVLKFLGKRRALIMPAGAYEKHGPYVTARAEKEPFLKALLRPNSKELPSGAIDYFSFREGLAEESLQEHSPRSEHRKR